MCSYKCLFDRRLTSREKWKLCVFISGSGAVPLRLGPRGPGVYWYDSLMASELWHFRDPWDPIRENVISPLKSHPLVFFTNTTQSLSFSHPSTPSFDLTTGLLKRSLWALSVRCARRARQGRSWNDVTDARIRAPFVWYIRSPEVFYSLSVLMAANTRAHTVTRFSYGHAHTNTLPSGTHHPSAGLWIYPLPKPALTGLLSVHPVDRPTRFGTPGVRRQRKAGRVNVKWTAKDGYYSFWVPERVSSVSFTDSLSLSLSLSFTLTIFLLFSLSSFSLADSLGLSISVSCRTVAYWFF